MGLLKDFGRIFNENPLAEDGEEEICKLTVSMDLTIEIVTTGIGEMENLRWEGHSSRMNQRISILKYLNS